MIPSYTKRLILVAGVLTPTTASGASGRIGASVKSHQVPKVSVTAQQLRLKLELDSRWASNPERKPSEQALNDLVPTARLGFLFEQRFDETRFEVDTAVEYQRFLGLQDSTTKDLSDVFGHARAKARTKITNILTLHAHTHARRDVETPDVTLLTRVPRWHFDAGTKLGFATENDTFMAQATYRFEWIDLEGQPPHLIRLHHRPGAVLKWTPVRNATFRFDHETTFTRYRAPTNDLPLDTHGDTNIARNLIGVTGKLSRYFTLTAQGGVGHLIAAAVNNTQDTIGIVELAYNSSKESKAYARAHRRLEPTSLFSYAVLTGAAAGLTVYFTDPTRLVFEGSYDHIQFGGDDSLRAPRIDERGQVRLELQTYWNDSFFSRLTNTFEVRRSNFQMQGTRTQYVRNDVWLTLGVDVL